MLPILFTIGPIKIYTLGIFLLLGFLWACFILWKHARLTSYQESEYFDVGFISFFMGVFLARLVYVMVHFNAFGFDILKFILINGYPGASFVGFVFGFIITLFVISYKKTGSIYKFTEYYLAPLVLAFSIAKLGSLFAGIDVGTKTTIAASVKYIGYSGLRHITPLYESLLYFISFLLLRSMMFKVRREEFKSGSVFFLFLLVIGCILLLLDNIKQNHIYFGPIPLNFAFGIVTFCAGFIYFILFYRNAILLGIKSVITLIHTNVKHIITRKNN